MIALRVARAVMGWSASQADVIAGYGIGYHRSIETGEHMPSPDALEILRVVYGDELAKAEMHYGPIATRKCGAPRRSQGSESR